MAPYPWQSEIWRRLLADRARLPHALLLHGRRGTGKRAFAAEFARALLCQTPTAAGPCGQCTACHLFEVGTHPDYRVIEPLEAGEAEEGSRSAGRSIAIAQVRELDDFVALSTHHRGPRVILVHPAEAMNAAAANAVLKTLEEPTENTVFLLVSHQPQQLLPTVRSRCRQIAMPMPDAAQARAWLAGQKIAEAELCLALAGGAPLEALRYADNDYLAARRAFLGALADPERLDWLKLAEQGARQDLPSQVDWLQKWVHDLVALRLAGAVRYNPDFGARLRELGERVNLTALLRFGRQLGGVRRHVQHPLNAQLLLESVFSSYKEALGAHNG
jgi:DNA polymerase-3 subunit delta'